LPAQEERASRIAGRWQPLLGHFEPDLVETLIGQALLESYEKATRKENAPAARRAHASQSKPHGSSRERMAQVHRGPVQDLRRDLEVHEYEKLRGMPLEPGSGAVEAGLPAVLPKEPREGAGPHGRLREKPSRQSNEASILRAAPSRKTRLRGALPRGAPHGAQRSSQGGTTED
jgi:hypothetical protein